MSHPDVEDLDKMVLLLSNKQGDDRMFIEVPDGSPSVSIPARVAKQRNDIGWFDQAWFAQLAQQSSKPTKDGTAYTLRNIRSGTYLQAKKLADGSGQLEMATRETSGPGGKVQTWYITDDGGFARIKNAKTGQVFELVEPGDGTPSSIVLRDNDSTNKETQTWKYERVSRSAKDVEDAMKANKHMPDTPVEYQMTDACYIQMPPLVREQIWKGTGLGSDSLVWRNQIFDCDDFAFAAKAAISRWAAENLRGEGFTILFGITFGERVSNSKKEKHAYNWYLDSKDLKKVVFFEPSNGYQSDDGWNYTGFSGIF